MSFHRCRHIAKKSSKRIQRLRQFLSAILSKKSEADQFEGIVDCALTFEELSEWLEAEKISFGSVPDENNESKARLFPITGGILRTMNLSSDSYSYLAMDGVENCITALKDIMSGNLSNCFIEMSACPGGCIGGPAMNKQHRLPVREYLAVDKYAGNEDFPVQVADPKMLKKTHAFIDISQNFRQKMRLTRFWKRWGKQALTMS